MRLRKKIEPDPEHPRFIKTVRNEGYIVPDGHEAQMNELRHVLRRFACLLACVALALSLSDARARRTRVAHRHQRVDRQ
jgi:hypothetical protein